MKTSVLKLACIALATLASSTRAAEPTADQLEFFEKKVRPILTERCYTCHSAQAKKLKGSLLLDSKAGVLKGGDTGPAITPGEVEKSLLVKAVRWTDKELQMPPKEQLPAAQVADLEAWIKMGAPDPRLGTVAQSPIEQRLADAKKHWSFQPIARPAVPTTGDTSITNPVDAFIQVKQKEKHLAFSPATDKRTLIRRAYFDLVGLPPTPEQVRKFVADDSPKAYEAVIDELLASPHYGERWGRHWLDVARYADIMGSNGNFGARELYPYAFTYRDYVIRSINDDKPINQFIMEQLAADLLPHPDGDNRTFAAMAFVTVGRRSDARIDDDVYDDRIDVISRGLLGLTAGCARCHDHKLEPIPSTDYYSLYGILKSCKDPDVYPEITPQEQTPASAKYVEESRKARQYLIDVWQKPVGEAVANSRQHIGDYLFIAKFGDHKTANDNGKVNDPLNKRKLLISPYNQIASRWDKWVVKNPKVFAPWLAFEALSTDGFADLAKPLADEFAANADGKLHPSVAKMFAGDAPKSLQDVADRYSKLFADIDSAWHTAAKDALTTAAKLRDTDLTLGEKDLSLDALRRALAVETAGEVKLQNADDEALRQILMGKDSATAFTAESLFVTQFYSSEAQKDFREASKQITALDALPGAPARAMVLQESKVVDSRVFVRGNPATLGADAPRRFYAALGSVDDKLYPKNASGRLQLAQDIASDKNPLTARVFVNRVWQWHFGQGLVRTPSDFGFRGEAPSHPELLDYLAGRFIDEGWSLKKLHRTLMLSRTYQQSSHMTAELTKADVDNRLWARMNARPLEFEPFRDSMLAVSSTIDLTIGGRAIDLTKTSSNRRTVYAFVDRKTLPSLFRSFDFPDPNFTASQRTHSAISPQALFLLNSPFVVDCAKGLVKQVKPTADHDKAAGVRELFELALQRQPSDRELSRSIDFMSRHPEHDVVVPEASDWTYGFGEYDKEKQAVRKFIALQFTGADIIRAGGKLKGKDTSGIILTREGGTAADGEAIIRRWTAPRDGHVDIYAELVDLGKTGVTCRILSSRTGLLGEWSAVESAVMTSLNEIEVKKGDVLDFLTESKKADGSDKVKWAPTITMRDSDIPGMKGMHMRWDARTDFMNPASMPQPLGAWEELAQVLLLSNEFAYAD